MGWFGNIFGGSKRSETALDRVQAAAAVLIPRAYREFAKQNGCAPTAKTSDSQILQIYSQVGSAFREVAARRGEALPAGYMNAIVFKFLQVHESAGRAFYEDHLKYEIEKFSEQGLRDDYKRDLRLF